MLPWIRPWTLERIKMPLNIKNRLCSTAREAKKIPKIFLSYLHNIENFPPKSVPGRALEQILKLCIYVHIGVCIGNKPRKNQSSIFNTLETVAIAMRRDKVEKIANMPPKKHAWRRSCAKKILIFLPECAQWKVRKSQKVWSSYLKRFRHSTGKTSGGAD